MIKIKSVHIEEFRGIRNLDIDLASQNFAICGPNGTGKSGIVDAIEFCLTGDVTRLSGQGTSGLSVNSHAPHVDHRSNPEKAIVKITAAIPSANKDVIISRAVSNPRIADVTPVDNNIEIIVKELQTHPEFALSRREIVKYIITPPGQRSKDVQTLLRLDYIENLRKSLTTFSNKLKTESRSAKANYRLCESELVSALDIAKFEPSLVLVKANEKRLILGLSNLTELTPTTSFSCGEIPVEEEDKKSMFSKSIALSDLKTLKNKLGSKKQELIKSHQQTIELILEKFKDDQQTLTLARKHGFISTGLELITENACPLCDTSWDQDELREHLQAKLLSCQEIEEWLDKLKFSVNFLIDTFGERTEALLRAINYCNKFDPPISHNEITTYVDQLETSRQSLTNVLEDHTQISGTLKVAKLSWWSLPKSVQEQLDDCELFIVALPESSDKDEARKFLSILQDRYERFVRACISVKNCAAQSELAEKILYHYNQTSNSVLEDIYVKVTEDFSRYYRIINHEDEDQFVGKLNPQPAKLTLDVDFYGRGTFQPGAYHSEGHQDAMGLCLYLALMKHTLGEKFTFTVLDDVLMSVDTGHRREVCRLLKTEFPNTQFILTTHDRVWLQYMKTEGLVQRSQSFGSWNVDSGPRVLDDQDIWTEIQAELNNNDVASAAWSLRRYLEYIATILADNFRAQIEFRGDANYDLGSLLPPVLKKWRKCLESAINATVRWKLETEEIKLTSLLKVTRKIIAKTSAEQWAINPSVHFNQWANFDKAEFQEVVNAYKELLENLRCSNPKCNSYFYITPQKGKAESIRCNCSMTNINLKSI